MKTPTEPPRLRIVLTIDVARLAAVIAAILYLLLMS
jgi:hypothetical protein